MDIRSGRPLVRLPFCPARGVDTGVAAGERGGVWEFRLPLTASLLSFGGPWTFEISVSESMMMWTCSSHTSDLRRDGGCSVSGVSKPLILL